MAKVCRENAVLGACLGRNEGVKRQGRDFRKKTMLSIRFSK